MPRKIKVSDITPENNEKDPVNDEVEAIKDNGGDTSSPSDVKGKALPSTEPVEETQEKQEEKVEETIIETPQDIPQETPTEIVEEVKEVTKTRKQELKQCPKCKKWLTAKTLFYFHQCTKNDVPKAKRRPKKVILKDIEDKNGGDTNIPSDEKGKALLSPPTPPPQKVKLERQTNEIVEQSEKFLNSLSTDKIDYTPKVEMSYEDMRRERIKQRIEQRSIKIKNLFSNAI